MLDLSDLWVRIVEISRELVWLSVAFMLLSALLKGRATTAWFRRCWGEARLNLFYYVLDVLLVVPILALTVSAINYVVIGANLSLFTASAYEHWPPLAVLLFCVMVSDLVGYWRHRLMHTRTLWPVHAIHHSDTEMTWTTLARFHPINRLLTVAFNTVVLSVLGIPPGIIALNGIFRHYYGFFEHADIPWTYGPLRYVFVSPVMHRWHHVREVQGSGSNFATVFALYDLLFGTFYMPRSAVPALGVTDRRFPDTWIGQTLYPFRVWIGRALAYRR